jgi:hypothetical protein
MYSALFPALDIAEMGREQVVLDGFGVALERRCRRRERPPSEARGHARIELASGSRLPSFVPIPPAQPRSSGMAGWWWHG